VTYPEAQSTTSRVSRAMATLRFTGERTTNPFLARLCKAKYTEAAAIEKLTSSGYRVRPTRTNPRSVW
jgi:hypothetical protein